MVTNQTNQSTAHVLNNQLLMPLKQMRPQVQEENNLLVRPWTLTVSAILNKESVLTVSLDSILMLMQLARKFLKIALRPTVMDNVQDAFKALQLKTVCVSKKYVTSPFVQHLTLTRQNASHVLRDPILSMAVVTKSMDNAHHGSQALENALHVIKGTS